MFQPILKTQKKKKEEKNGTSDVLRKDPKFFATLQPLYNDDIFIFNDVKYEIKN